MTCDVPDEAAAGRSGGRWAGLLALVLALVSAAVLAPAPTFGQTSYPAARDGANLAAWLKQVGDDPTKVIAVSPSVVTLLVSRRPELAKGGDVTLRAEALSPETAARGGVVTWEMPLSVNCQTGMVRLGATAGYPERGGGGEPVPLAPAEPAWRTPPPGSVVHGAWRAVCDPAFRPPLGEAVAPPRAPSALEHAASAMARPPPLVRKGTAAVQVVSSADVQDSRRSATELRRRFGQAFASLEVRVQTAQVGGRTVHRGLVTGFATRVEAQAFCRALKANGHDCLTR